jgi:hypothetical protein
MFIGISCIHAWIPMDAAALFHGGNRGSNPLGDANIIIDL